MLLISNIYRWVPYKIVQIRDKIWFPPKNTRAIVDGIRGIFENSLLNIKAFH